jgi:ATP-dependent exoDNAse (exonuclease V) alpha subunit
MKNMSEAQEQQRRCIAEKNEDHDYLQNQLKYKMAENESLTQTIKDLTTKLNISKDEIIQLKTSMASSIHEELRAPTNLQPPTKIQQPSVLLIGTSNIEGCSTLSLGL